MFRLHHVLTALPLAAAAVVLASCGGSTPVSSPNPAPASSAAASPSVPESSPTEASSSLTSSSASPTESTANGIKDPCDTIPSADMAKFIGVEVGKAISSSDAKSKSCEYAPSASGKTVVYTLVGNETESLKSNLSSLEKKAKVTKIDIGGFDEAYSLSGTRAGGNVGAVAAKRGDLIYVAAVVGAKSFEAYEGYSEQIVTALAS